MLPCKILEKHYNPEIVGSSLSLATSAGKSTLMNLIPNNIKRDGGVITFDDRKILEMGNDFCRVLGYMPQQQGIIKFAEPAVTGHPAKSSRFVRDKFTGCKLHSLMP